jgi:hypothetical protein
MATLDNILSGEGNAAPALEQTETPVNQETQAAEANQPAQTNEDEPRDDIQESPDGRKMVPLEALQESRGKAKRYTEQVADFEKTVGGLREQNANLARQVTELLQRIPQQEKPQQQVPDFFENPAEATKHFVAPQFEQISQTLQAIAKDNAIVRYTEERVDAAEEAFMQAMQSRALDPADYQKVVSAPNRYAAAVQWHERQKALTEIGTDPTAYKAKIEAEILARHGIAPGTPQNGLTPQQTAVMPSNLAGARNVGTRAGPAWSGPTPLADIFKR